jgi:hypothetical protein
VSSADWTAVGTIGLAVVTLIAVVTTIIITSQDRERADKQLGGERERSDNDRCHARDREQLAEAYQVEVALGQKAAGEPKEPVYEEPDDSVRQLAALVVNHGSYTISGIEARFIINGKDPISPASDTRLGGYDKLPARLQAGHERMEDTRFGDVLTRWDVGMRFKSYPVPERDLVDAYPVVRRTDRWGTRWQHQRGEVRQVKDNPPWIPLEERNHPARR